MTDFFPDISPMEEMTCSQSPPGQSSVSLPDVSPVNSVLQVQSSIGPLLASDVGDSADKPDVANNPAKADVTMTVEPLSTPQSSVVPTTPKSGCSIGSTPGSGQSSSAESTDVISKYLVQYVPATPRSRNQSVDRVTGSRVLTSSEGLAMLKEKEEKKKREIEEKKKKKLEMEERKKEREELAKKKAESRLKKAAEKSLTKKPPARKRVSQLYNHKKQQKKPLYLNPLRLSQLLLNPLHLLPSHQSFTDSECCECLHTYAKDVHNETGAEWVMRVCGRWLHEECIDLIQYDANGSEKLCSYCVV